MANVRHTIEITKMPEVIADLRNEMARLLVREAEAEIDPRVTRRLREIAAMFEAGVTHGD